MYDPELPEKENTLLREIRKKYQARFEPLRIGGFDFQLLQITDIEPLLGGRDPFADISAFPVWVKLWESAMILSDFIARQPLPRAGSRRLLELGAGLGVPSLVAAKKGYAVTASDYEDIILKFLRINAAANGMESFTRVKLDWLKPQVMDRFDTIIGAEVLFRDDLFTPLLTVFRQTLAPDGVIYLAHDGRRKSLPVFLKMAEAEYDVAISPRKLNSEDGEITIIIARLTPRNQG